jgi:excisionase family DNA binding protein
MSETTGGPERFLTGDRAFVVAPAEVVAKLLERTSLDVLRVSARGADSEVYDLLMALRLAALAHPSSDIGTFGSDVGTFVAEQAEPGPYSLLTTAEAATLIGITPRAVLKAIREGRLLASQNDATYLIKRDDAKAFRSNRRK